MSDDELRTAEKVLLECCDLVQRTCSLERARNRLLIFAQQYAERYRKLERLRGRIEQTIADSKFVRDFTHEGPRELRYREYCEAIASAIDFGRCKLEAELAALESMVTSAEQDYEKPRECLHMPEVRGPHGDDRCG